ncbi:MAG: SoxXA-binding protein [Pseudomonadota bacterium]|nr:MAG: SoxXA-binding protein [Pseudomonadota bacterium]
MKKLASLAIAIVVALMLSACAGGEKAPAVSAEDAQAAIAAAKDATNKAKSVGYEWRDTGKVIKGAEAALKEGKVEDAIKLANKAKRQSENAYAQYEANKGAGPRY